MSLTGYQIGGALNTINQAQNMPAPIVPAIVGALGSIGSSLIGNRGRKRSERRARKFNLEMWHKQNRYNHPIEQMARLKDAGLNPNLIYGSSPGSAVGNAGQVAPGKAEDYQFANPAIPAFNAQLQSAQTLNTLEQAGLNKVNKQIKQRASNSLVEIEAHRAEQMKEQAFQEAIRSGILSKTQEDEINIIKANLKLLKAQGKSAEYKVEVDRLDAWIAKMYRMRPSDPFWLRSLAQIASILLPNQEIEGFYIPPIDPDF
tara:strand:+ start:350 stop:1126 length:777 start_codon:yes stop_codon:yes gene_type:complete